MGYLSQILVLLSISLYISLSLSLYLDLYLYLSLSLQLFSISISLYSLYPFFLVFVWYISLLSSHSSLSFLLSIGQGMGYGPEGRGCRGQGWGELMKIPEFLSPRGGTGTRSELKSQSHTHTFREREKRRGGGEVENGRKRRMNRLQIHKFPVSLRLSHTNYQLSTHAPLS